MMRFNQIERQDWKVYLDLMSDILAGNCVQLEVSGLDVGDQIQIRWTPLDGFSYDPKQDRILLYTDADTHQIPRPSAVVAFEEGVTLKMLTIRDAVGRIQVMKFREPLKLGIPNQWAC